MKTIYFDIYGQVIALPLVCMGQFAELQFGDELLQGQFVDEAAEATLL